MADKTIDLSKKGIQGGTQTPVAPPIPQGVIDNREKNTGKGKERRRIKKERLVALIAYVLSQTVEALKLEKDPVKRKSLEEIQFFAKSLTPGSRMVGGPSVIGGKLDVYNRFAAKKIGETVTETELFNEFKIARSDMRKHMRRFIKDQEPAKRIWVSFDTQKNVYVVAGIGANAPKDWTGYRPVEVAEVDLG